MRFGSVTAGSMAEAAVIARSGRVPVGTWIRIRGARSVRFAGIGIHGAPVLVSGAAAAPRYFAAVVRAVRAARLASVPAPRPVAIMAPAVAAAVAAVAMVAGSPDVADAARAAVLVAGASAAGILPGAGLVGAAAAVVATVRRAGAGLVAIVSPLSQLPATRGGIRFPRVLPRDASVTVPAQSGKAKDDPPWLSMHPPGNGPPPPGRVAPNGAMSGTRNARF